MTILRRAFLMLAVLFVSLTVSSFAEDVTSSVRSDRSAPIRIVKVTGKALSNQRVLMCIAFQNLATKSVSSVRFHIAVLDQFNSEVIRKDGVYDANSAIRSGHTSNPPDASSSNARDPGDGSLSCYMLNSADAVTNGNGVNLNAISVTVRNVRFTDGSTWSPGDSFERAFNADGSRFAPEFPTTWSTEPENSAPIVVTSANIHSTTFGEIKREQCVSFRDVSDKTATFVKFEYTFTDINGDPLPDRTFTNTFSGTFTPPIAIENKCTQNTLPPLDQIRRMRFEKIRLVQANFSDGSSWTPGMAYAKRFNAVDGSPFSGTQPFVTTPPPGPLPTPTPMPTATPTPTPTPTPAPTPTQNGFSMVVNANSSGFGEIAWVPGSFSIHGASVDQPTYEDAAIAALEACREKAGSQKDRCVTVIKANRPELKTAAARCATFVFDGHVGALGAGTSKEDAVANALDNLKAKNGQIIHNHYIESVCNGQ